MTAFLCHFPGLARAALAVLALAGGAALAQKIDDIPPAVQNNVPPNFMFMIDNSGSMSNIVPAAPYSATATYLASCASGSLIPAGTSVDLNIVGGVPKIVYGGTTYRHTTATSGTQTTRCFNNTATYGARLLADTGTTTKSPSGYLDSDYTGHFLNWYFGNYGGAQSGWTDRKLVSTGAVETRIEIARRSAKSAIDSLPIPTVSGARAAVRVGLSTYNASPLGGLLKLSVRDLDTTSRSAIKTQIDTLTPSGATPLAATLADIGRYMATGYNGNVSTANDTGVAIDTLLRMSGADANPARNSCVAGSPVSCNSTSATAAQKPIQYWCQRTSIFAMTDGRPQNDRVFDNNTYVRDYDKDCTGANAAQCKDATGSVLPYDRKNAATGRSYESNGSDYMDDVAKLLFDTDLRPDLVPASGAKRGKNNISTYMIGFADPAVQNDPLLINTGRQGGGRFLAATDAPTLLEAFQNVISDALAIDAAAAAVAVTSAQITSGTIGYASSYTSGNWYGDLEAYSLDQITGLRNGPVQWSARDKLAAQDPTTRRIVTFSGTTGTGAGLVFSTANGGNFRGAGTSPSDAVINYTRGDRSGEGSTFRQRSYVLGDIINAEPVAVSYTAGSIVYQASNDGMLHAFDGRIDASVATRGKELWAYVPRLVHSRLADRASTGYDHVYLVDATPAVADMSGTGAGTVGKILVGGLGKGGAGYYALDITSGTAATDAEATAKVLWEFKPTNMGYSFGTPLVVKTADGWRVVVSSGLANDGSSNGIGGDGRGYVWVLEASTGAVMKTFVTPSGFGSASASLGLTHLSKSQDLAPSADVRFVYSGDLQGNVWRFDLTAPDLASPVRIAQLTAPDGSAQPVTAAVTVAPVTGSTNRQFVYVGTGQYFSIDDVPGSSTPNTLASQVESFYGIIDDTSVAAPTLPNIRGSNGAACPADGGTTDYLCQSLTTAADGSQTVTHNAMTATKRGFYLDLGSLGRVTTRAALSAGGTLSVVVNKPTNVVCNPGGTSTLLQLSSANGGAVARTYGGTVYYPALYSIGDALSSRPLIVITGDGVRAILRLSDRSTQSVKINETSSGSPAFRRIYMRPLN
ncbi:hypothetical protein LZ009_20100 [Ramlibacter sp. XY19]|uniref:PilC/PilY family type IV pilus protein n=1 Tax=Ramlibacter paludis TaxID=2908000 RepID=UPI0023DBCBD9|nr:PilC/PilY family type IV pilus protein [Ramlibacter paludis]MCG2595088.1 hypothetical protein [Ramlibacter paludis]